MKKEREIKRRNLSRSYKNGVKIVEIIKERKTDR
jgi:hypothetical protein